MTITFGWWAIPAVITAVAMTWALMGDYAPRGDYDFGTPVIGLLKLGAAVIVSLLAWLVWSLVA